MTRETGNTVFILDTEKLQPADGIHTVEFMRTGLIFNAAGDMRTINTEGVQDALKDGVIAVYTWGGYLNFTPEQLLAAETNETEDLSTFIRSFGQRLETNFYLAKTWIKGE